MSKPGESVIAATNKSDAYVRTRFNNAKELLKKGDYISAWYEFGLGLHTLQDATSPAHAGFQKWNGSLSLKSIKGLYVAGSHVIKEFGYPGRNSNLQKVTNHYVNWFINSNNPLPKENLFKSLGKDATSFTTSLGLFK